ncbi:ribonuclease H domain-containing protein [Tanacetum coccineum]
MGISYSYLFEADDDLANQCQIQDIQNFELESQPSHFLNVSENYEYYKVYCKCILHDFETVEASFGGIGVAICDMNDRQVWEVQTVVSVGRSMVGRHAVVELEALIEGLNAAVRLGLERVHVYCDNVSVYRYLMGEAWPTTNTVMTLVDKFNLFQRTFADCGLFLVGPSDIKFAYELARDAIIFQTTNFEEDTFGKTLVEECTICYHEIERDQMFSVNQCRHTYCLPCMRKHVEAKLFQGQLPGCPYENCKSELQIDSCKKFLTPKLYNIMSIRHRIVGVSAVGARIWLNSLTGATISIADVDMSFATRAELSTSIRKQRASVLCGMRVTLYTASGSTTGDSEIDLHVDHIT